MTKRQSSFAARAAAVSLAVALHGAAFADGDLASERRGIGLEPASSVGATFTIDSRRSLAVTDQNIVDLFTFQELVDRLVSPGSVAGLTSPLDFFEHWWDTQRAGASGTGWHCNNPGTVFNGFPYECPRPEGAQADTNPFVVPPNSDGYRAVGLFNRFDLAAADGSDCGEYRIVFARRSGIASAVVRNLVIFEANLANPHPDRGLNGCVRVAEFWRDLSTDNSQASRGTKLHNFYYEGLPGFLPVVHPKNYGARADRKGQIRTNQFMRGNDPQIQWMLREFKLAQFELCSGMACTTTIQPVTVKTNPSASLFTDAPTFLNGQFQNELLAQIPQLAVADINRFNYEPSAQFLTGQSEESNIPANNYVTSAGPLFKAAIQNKLDSLKVAVSLTPDQVLARVQALSCNGCHLISNGADVGLPQSWPSSQVFTHVSERATQASPDGGTRFAVSPALTGTFLPFRNTVLTNYLVRTDPLPRCNESCVTWRGVPAMCVEILVPTIC